MFRTTMMVLATLVLAAAGGRGDDKKDATAGKWVIESVTRDGAADDGLKGATRTHADGMYEVKPA